MNTIEHWQETKKKYGVKIASLSVLPDIFVLIRKITPIPFVKEFCLKMHNTDEGIEIISKLNPSMELAWRIHKKQDLESHDFKYDFSDRIPKDSILLLSGGLDSFIQWRLLNQPRAIYFKIGHKAMEKELDILKKIEKDFGGDIIIENRLNLADIEMKNGYIPYRNLFFIMLASLISRNVVICQISEYAPDKNRVFYKNCEALLSKITTGSFQALNLKPVRIYSPFSGYTKTELVHEYLKKYPAEELLKYTVSCYQNYDIPCGECNACISRHIALVNNGIKEETKIPVDISKISRRWSIKDFKFYNIPMYIKRTREIKEYKEKVRKK